MNYGIGNNVTTLIPGIECRKFCADGVGPTGAIGFTGYVTNTGNTPLSNVGVTNSVNGVLGIITNNITLPVGGAVNFSGSYQGVRGPNMNVIFVGGIDALGSNVTSQCEATCTTVLESRADTSNFFLSFATGTDRTYTVEFTSSLSLGEWQSLTNLPGDGTVVTVRDSITNAQRFYRVLAQ